MVCIAPGNEPPVSMKYKTVPIYQDKKKKRQEVYALLKDQEIRNSKLMMPKPVFWIIKDNILIFLPCILYQVA